MKGFRIFWMAWWAATIGCPLLGAAQVDSISDSDVRLIAGLRQRGLYDLADRHCRIRLSQQPVPAEFEATLVIELMRTQMSRALAMRDVTDRAAAWEQSRAVADEFLGQRPEHPRRLLIQVQQGLSLIAEGRLLAQEWAVRRNDESLREAATQRLRAARTWLDALQRDIARQLPLAPRARNENGALSNDELRALANHLNFQVAQCHVLRAELAADDEITRLDSLNMALEHLDQVTRQVDPANELWWTTQLSRIATWRMARQTDKAINAFRQLDVHKLPATLTNDYWAERIELALVGFNVEEALSWWRDYAQRGLTHPRIDLAALRLILHEASGQLGGRRAEWLAQASQWTAQIESRHGPYWGQLAEYILVDGASRLDVGGPNTSPAASWDILMRVGDSAAREGRLGDALEAYRQAQQQLLASSHDAATWQLVFTTQLKISALLEQQGQFAAAADELIAIALRQPAHELADTLHLRAAWCWAQVSTADGESRQRYRAVLAEHIDRWPTRATSDQARIWLARIEMTREPSAQIVDWLCQVRADGPHAEAAARELAVAAPAYLETIAAKNPAVLHAELQRVVNSLRHWMATIPQGSHQESTATWHLRIALGRVRIRFEPQRADQILQELSAALITSPPTDETIAALAQAQEYALRVATGDSSHGEPRTLDRTQTNPRALNECLRSMEWLATAHPSSSLIEAQLEIIAALLAANPDDPTFMALTLKRSRLLRQQGDTAGAIEELSRLAARYPRRLDVQRELALAWMDEPQQVAAALSQWRKIAAATREHTEPWYEAKYYVARLLIESGQREQARQMLEYLKTVPPGWQQSTWRDEFEKLLAQSRQR